MFNPKYTLTDEILKNISYISEVKHFIETAKIIPVSEIKLQRMALIRMSQGSTAIEGNILNQKQVENILADKKIDAPNRDVFEVKNYLSALKYIGTFVKKNRKLSLKTILKIHRLVTQNTLDSIDSGCFRSRPVYVVRHFFGLNKKIIYTAPSSKQVPKLVSELISWINQSEVNQIHPIVVAAVAHQEIAAIHPFSDGNGRTARALATLILYQKGYDFRRLFALEDYYNSDRQKYYQAINCGEKYISDKNLTNWISYFISGFKDEINNIKTKIQQISIKIGSDKKQIFLTEDEQKIISFIDQFGQANSADITKILSVSKRTAQLRILKLKKSGLIKQNGQGPSSTYIIYNK